jgi:hypothetical protein
MDLEAMAMKVIHSPKNITHHSSSEAASHPRRLESLVERQVLLRPTEAKAQCALAHLLQNPTDCSLHKEVLHATTTADTNMLVSMNAL